MHVKLAAVKFYYNKLLFVNNQCFIALFNS